MFNWWFRTCLLFVGFLIIAYSGKIKRESFDCVVNKITCTNVNPKYIRDISCYTINKNRTEKLHYILAYPVRPLRQLYLRIQYFYKFTIYRPFLLDTEESLCGFLNHTNRAPMLETIWEIIKKSSNMDQPCPLIFINISGLSLKTTVYSPLSPGEIRVDSHVNTGKRREPVFKISLYARVTSKLLKKKNRY